MHAIACSSPSLQFRVFRLSLLQDGDVGVGVFPEDEEVLVGGAGLGEGGAWERGHLARSLLFPTGGRDARAPSYAGFQCVRSAQAQVRQRADRLVQDDARVVENFLEFGGCRGTLVRGQVRLAPQVDRVKGKVQSLAERVWAQPAQSASRVIFRAMRPAGSTRRRNEDSPTAPPSRGRRCPGCLPREGEAESRRAPGLPSLPNQTPVAGNLSGWPLVPAYGP